MKNVFLIFTTGLIILAFLCLGCTVINEPVKTTPDNFDNTFLENKPNKAPFIPSNRRIKTRYYFDSSNNCTGYFNYIYDSTGLKTAEYYTTSSNPGTYGPLKYKRTYTQYNYRTMLCEYESDYYGDKSYVYEWDSSGNYITKILNYNYKDELERYWTFSRNSSGKIIQKKLYNASGINTYTYDYYYNSAGDLSFISFISVVGSGLYRYLAYYYDSNGTLTYIASYNYSNNKSVLSYYSAFTYNDNYIYRVFYNASNEFSRYEVYAAEDGTPRYTPYDPLLAYNLFYSY